MKIKNNSSKKPFAYDHIPYASYPFKKTHPAYLRSIAKFFKFNAPELKQAKILELGCASGGNIIPMACNLPESAFTGIDLSNAQIADGEKSLKPHASDYARYQAALGTKIVNQRHEIIVVDMLQRMLLLYMNGQHTDQQIIDFLCQHIKNQELKLLDDDNQPVQDQVKILEWSSQQYAANIDFLLMNALLIG